MELRAQGYDVPVDNSSSDVEAYAFLQAANSAGAAALVLNMLPGSTFDPDSPDENQNRRRGLWGEMEAAIKVIRSGDLPASRSVTTEVTKAHAGSRLDSQGNEKSPAFTRERTSYPGVWG